MLKKALKKVLNEKSTQKSAQQSTQKTLNGKSTQKSAQKTLRKVILLNEELKIVFLLKKAFPKKIILKCTNIFKKVLKKASALSGTEFSLIEDGFGY